MEFIQGLRNYVINPDFNLDFYPFGRFRTIAFPQVDKIGSFRVMAHGQVDRMYSLGYGPFHDSFHQGTGRV